jgi:DNA-binding MarR family transcriptional regulator
LRSGIDIKTWGFQDHNHKIAAMGNSIFDLRHQQDDLDGKIVIALERLSESFRVALWNESKEMNLSPIQIQILVFLLYHEPEKRKVSYLAQEFNMTKATVSDAVRALWQKQLIGKETEPGDSRSYVIHLTETGKATAAKCASFADFLLRPLQSLPEERRTELLKTLLELIYQLNRSGVIQVQRMCFNCRYLGEQQGGYYCRLMEQPLKDADLRVDCPEFEGKTGKTL